MLKAKYLTDSSSCLRIKFSGVIEDEDIFVPSQGPIACHFISSLDFKRLGKKSGNMV
jgi:hypothetical protein